MEDYATYAYTQFVTEVTTFNISVTTSSLATTSVTTTQHLVTETVSSSPTKLFTLSITSEEPDNEFVFDSYPQRVFIAALLLIATLVGTIGNALVILAVLFAQKLSSVTNTFVFNLAVADLLVSLSLPWNAVALLAKDGWPLPHFICSAAGGIVIVCVGCSVFTLASIAITRLIKITKTVQWYNKIFSMKVISIWISLTWLLPFVVGVIPTLAGFGQLGYNSKYHSCSSISTAPHSNEYDILTTVVFFPVSLLIMVVSYATIFAYVRKHTLKFDRTRHKNIVGNGKSSTLSGNNGTLQQEVSSKISSSLPIVKEEETKKNTDDNQQTYRQKIDEKGLHLEDADLEADSTDVDTLMDDSIIVPPNDLNTKQNITHTYSNPDESLITDAETSLCYTAEAQVAEGDVPDVNPKQSDDSAYPASKSEMSLESTDHVILSDPTKEVSNDHHVSTNKSDAQNELDSCTREPTDANIEQNVRYVNYYEPHEKSNNLNSTSEHSHVLLMDEVKIPISESTQNILKEIDSEIDSTNSTATNTKTRKTRTDVLKTLTFARPKLSNHEIEITKNMFYVVVAFLISFTPFTFCMIIDSSDPLLPYATAIVFINSCINPIIYAIKHPNFKTTFSSIVKCRLDEIKPPSTILRALFDKGVCCCRKADGFPA